MFMNLLCNDLQVLMRLAGSAAAEQLLTRCTGRGTSYWAVVLCLDSSLPLATCSQLFRLITELN